MISFKNVSGVPLEVRRAAYGGQVIEPDGTVEVDGKLGEELEDAFIVERPMLERDREGNIVDAIERTAWPKAIWSKANSKSANSQSKKDEKTEEGK